MIRAFATKTFLALSIAVGLPAAVSAATLTIDSATAAFTNTRDRAGQTVAGEGTSGINWGVGVKGGFNSAYNFTANTLAAESGSFVLGMMEHRNGTIWRSNSTLVSADLEVGFSGRLAGQDFSFSRKIGIEHNETRNRQTPCAEGGGTPCADAVRFDMVSPFELQVTSERKIYRLTVEGLVDGPGGEATTKFLTEEKDRSFAYLIGNLSVELIPPSAVPLPPAGLALLGGMLVLAGLRRRRI